MYSEDKSIFNSFEYTINKRSHDLVKFLVLHLLNDKIEDVRKSKGYAAQQPLLKTRKIYLAITHELPQRKWKIRRKLSQETFPFAGRFVLYPAELAWVRSTQSELFPFGRSTEARNISFRKGRSSIQNYIYILPWVFRTPSTNQLSHLNCSKFTQNYYSFIKGAFSYLLQMKSSQIVFLAFDFTLSLTLKFYSTLLKSEA